MLPIQFDYVYESYNSQLVHVTVIQQIKQYFTGETIYRIREESEEGWVDERIVREAHIKEMLAKRVKEE